MSKTIKQLADELGISKQAVTKRIDNLGCRSELIMVGGQFQINKETEERIKNYSPTDNMKVSGNWLAVRQPPTDEVVVDRQPPTDEVVVDHQPPTDEMVGDRQPPTDEVVVDRQPPTNEVVVDCQPPTDEMVVDRQPPTDEMVVDRQPPTDEMVVDRQPPTDEMVGALTEQIVAKDAIIAKQQEQILSFQQQLQEKEHEISELRIKAALYEQLQKEVKELKADKADLQQHRDNLTNALIMSKSDLVRLENIVTQMAALPLGTRIFCWTGAVQRLTDKLSSEIDAVQEQSKVVNGEVIDIDD